MPGFNSFILSSILTGPNASASAVEIAVSKALSTKLWAPKLYTSEGFDSFIA